MDSQRLVELLEQVRRGKVGVSQAVARLRHLPFEDLGFAKVDHHRALRQGFPEVIMGQGKTPREIAGIVRALRRRRANVLVTRVDDEKMTRLKKLVTELKYHPEARAVTWIGKPIKITGKGTILVVSAGTSDIPVAQEAVITATLMGNREKTFRRRRRGYSSLAGEPRAVGCSVGADRRCRDGRGASQRCCRLNR